MVSDKNDEASLALAALRKAMKLTQQEFAVTILNSAVTTISRWESGNPPPRGDSLLRLHAVAREQKLREQELHNSENEATFHNCMRVFERVWIIDVSKVLGPDIRTMVYGDDNPTTGLLVASLEGAEAFPGAEAFLHILQQLESKDPKFHQNAVSALSSLQAAARKFDPPGTHDMRDRFTAFLTRGAPKRGRPPKRPSGNELPKGGKAR
jgi:transcriptional regulator with XRE-family HTH domain